MDNGIKQKIMNKFKNVAYMSYYPEDDIWELKSKRQDTLMRASTNVLLDMDLMDFTRLEEIHKEE